jgi:hypothetical protein
MFRRPTPNAGNPESLVPAAVRQLLVKGEEVEARYELKGAQAYATATRLIILRGEETASHNYDHIAGTRDISSTNVWLILGGFALFAFGGTSAFFPVAGAALILLGILTRARRLELLVTGVREPVVLNGAREVLGPLVQKLSEKGARKLGA